MPSALGFIGGGLLTGIGKGLAEQGKLKGVALRERALADIKHERTLERDKNQQTFRTGLLTKQEEYKNERFGNPIAGQGADGRPAFFQATPGGDTRVLQGVTPPPKTPGALTVPQLSSNTETDSARAFWRETIRTNYGGDARKMMDATFQLNPFTKGLEPRDKAMGGLWAKASRRKTGADPDYDNFMRMFMPQAPTPDIPPPPAAGAEGPGLIERGVDYLFGGDDTGAADPPAGQPPPGAVAPPGAGPATPRPQFPGPATTGGVGQTMADIVPPAGGGQTPPPPEPAGGAGQVEDWFEKLLDGKDAAPQPGPGAATSQQAPGQGLSALPRTPDGALDPSALQPGVVYSREDGSRWLWTGAEFKRVR